MEGRVSLEGLQGGWGENMGQKISGKGKESEEVREGGSEEIREGGSEEMR